MKFKIVINCILFCTFSLQSIADENLESQVIYAIDTAPDGSGIRYLFENGKKLEGCTNSSVFVENSSISKSILNIALAAHYAKKAVNFRIQGCHGGSMKAVAIELSETPN